MKNITILFLLFSSFSFAQQWEDAESLPGSARRHHPVTFSLNGFGYSFVGSDSFDVSTATGYKYDPTSESWDSIDDFPGLPRGFSYGVDDEEFGYMGFGYNDQTGDFYNDLWKFDPNTEAWEELATCPCQARTHPAMILADGKIFVGAGGSASGNLKDWWEYNIASDTWIEHADLPGVPRHHPFYFGLNDEAYVGFGHGNGIFNDFYKFKPSTNSWVILDDFPGEARVAGTQFSEDGFGYILSGDGDDHDFMVEGEFWQYNADSDEWTQLPSHPGQSRWAPGSFVLDGVVYLVQGQERFQNQFPGSEISNTMLKFDLELYNSPFSVEDEDLSSFEVYPNPALQSINISSSIDLGLRIEIYNTLGSIVLESSESKNIDISELNTGTYTIRIIGKNEIQISQFVKI